MYEFNLSLAGQVLSIAVPYPPIQYLCRGFVTGEPAQWRVAVELEDVDYERERSARNDRWEGREPEEHPELYLGFLALYRKIAEKMPEYNTFLFHGSVVAVDGQGYLFTAKSGTGKSTHTGLWRQVFGDRAVMVNDDKPLIQITDEGVFVCGTPWKGKHKLGANLRVPLKGICILTRAEENVIRPLSAAEAMPMLIQQTYRPADPVALSKTLTLLRQLTERTGLYRLGCNMDPQAALVAYNGMNEKEIIL